MDSDNKPKPPNPGLTENIPASPMRPAADTKAIRDAANQVARANSLISESIAALESIQRRDTSRFARQRIEEALRLLRSA
jgi:hypothetical protein